MTSVQTEAEPLFQLAVCASPAFPAPHTRGCCLQGMLLLSHWTSLSHSKLLCWTVEFQFSVSCLTHCYLVWNLWYLSFSVVMWVHLNSTQNASAIKNNSFLVIFLFQVWDIVGTLVSMLDNLVIRWVRQGRNWKLTPWCYFGSHIMSLVFYIGSISTNNDRYSFYRVWGHCCSERTR